MKNAIFGGNNARLYNYKPKTQAEVLTDRTAQIKDTYEREGGDRSNLYYGYIRKRAV